MLFLVEREERVFRFRRNSYNLKPLAGILVVHLFEHGKSLATRPTPGSPEIQKRCLRSLLPFFAILVEVLAERGHLAPDGRTSQAGDVIRAFRKCHRQRNALAITENFNIYFRTHSCIFQNILDLRHIDQFLAIDPDDQVSRNDTRRKAARFRMDARNKERQMVFVKGFLVGKAKPRRSKRSPRQERKNENCTKNLRHLYHPIKLY